MNLTTISLTMLAAAAALPLPAQSGFEWKDLGGRLELREEGAQVLIYNYGPQLKDGAPENRRRCCYIFPLRTPAGVSMLDDFPQDHWHHRGLFWAWPVVEAGGKTYDEWMNMTALDRAVGRPTWGIAASKGAYVDASNVWQADGKDIVREHVRVSVARAQRASRELAVEVILEAIDAPVKLRGSREAGKSYGGFSARFAPREGTVLRADDEKLAKDEDLTPRHWAELEGTYGGKRAVLRITTDPMDIGAPYQWCLRNYGFVGASFPGRTADQDGFTLQPGQRIPLRFTVKVSDAQ
jgi:hypothetical protein